MFSRRHKDDEGSALVAAVGVAMIGAALCLIVVAQSISVTRDAGRDAVRTSEVHAAEAVVDTLIERLNVSNPCPTVTFNNVAQGSVAVNVVATISYADAAGPLTTCTGGVIVGTPTRATISATSTPVQASVGLEPVRTLEASVQLVPRAGHSAAIYSATQPSNGAGFTLGPLIPTDTANVWVDAGNFDCNTNITIDGNLTVVQGSTTMSGGCSVSGHVWTQTSLTVNSSSSLPRAGDGVTVRTGNLNIANANQVFYGNIELGGVVTGWNANTMQVINGSVFTNQTIPNLTPIGLPVVGIVPSDWAGFTFKSRAGWKADMIAGTVGGINTYQTGQLDSCTLANWMANSQTGGFAYVNLPQFVAYDLTGTTGLGCSQLKLQNIHFVLTGDVVFFVKDLSATNPVEAVSGDGQPHNIWFIVPNKNHPSMPSGYASGNITFDSASNKFQNPISIFLYTPGNLNFNNPTLTSGQMYAKKVTIGPNTQFEYTSVGIPGVNLSTTHAVGSDVSVEYKRETSP